MATKDDRRMDVVPQDNPGLSLSEQYPDETLGTVEPEKTNRPVVLLNYLAHEIKHIDSQLEYVRLDDVDTRDSLVEYRAALKSTIEYIKLITEPCPPEIEREILGELAGRY